MDSGCFGRKEQEFFQIKYHSESSNLFRIIINLIYIQLNLQKWQDYNWYLHANLSLFTDDCQNVCVMWVPIV